MLRVKTSKQGVAIASKWSPYRRASLVIIRLPSYAYHHTLNLPSYAYHPYHILREGDAWDRAIHISSLKDRSVTGEDSTVSVTISKCQKQNKSQRSKLAFILINLLCHCIYLFSDMTMVVCPSLLMHTDIGLTHFLNFLGKCGNAHSFHDPPLVTFINQPRQNWGLLTTWVSSSNNELWPTS